MLRNTPARSSGREPGRERQVRQVWHAQWLARLRHAHRWRRQRARAPAEQPQHRGHAGDDRLFRRAGRPRRHARGNATIVGGVHEIGDRQAVPARSRRASSPRNPNGTRRFSSSKNAVSAAPFAARRVAHLPRDRAARPARERQPHDQIAHRERADRHERRLMRTAYPARRSPGTRRRVRVRRARRGCRRSRS